MPMTKYIHVSLKSNSLTLLRLTSSFSDNYQRYITRLYGCFGGDDFIDLMIVFYSVPGDVSFKVKMKYIVEPKNKLFKLYEKDKLMYLYFTSKGIPFTGFIQSRDGVNDIGLDVDNTFTEVPIE